MDFQPYDVSNAFLNNTEVLSKGKIKDMAQDILKILYSEEKNEKQSKIKIKSCKTWLDKLQII